MEIADECGLECVEWSNFHEYVRGKLRDDGSTATATATDASTEGKKTRPGEIAGGAATAHELWRQTMGGRSVHEVTLSEDEWEAAYLYATFAFKRKGTSAAAGGGGVAAAQAQARVDAGGAGGRLSVRGRGVRVAVTRR